jgi:hypothetical protein
MARLQPLPLSETHDSVGVLDRLVRLVRLTIELGIAETRQVATAALVAVAIAVISGIALVAALVVLLAGALAPLFDARWEPFVISGGAVALAAVAALGWSALRLRRLRWPRETVAAIQETWRWLATQTRSRLISR